MAEIVEQERSTLSLARAVVCLHFVQQDAVPPDSRPEYPDCPVLASLELDLLSHRFQSSPPLGSQCESYKPVPIEIVYPPSVTFRSEGRTIVLQCPAPTRPAEAVFTSTLFTDSGVRVWHMTIGPRAGGTFGEYDLIKLTHLHEGRSEKTDLANSIRFRLLEVIDQVGEDNGLNSINEGNEGDARRGARGLHSLAGLLRAVCPEAKGNVELRGGTVQVLVGEMRAGDCPLSELVNTAAEAGDSLARLTEWMESDCGEHQALAALAGITTGILDFRHMDVGEVIDSLEPSVAGGSPYARFHRATLIAISGDDRVATACGQSVGISPYLILPHAVLIHNDALVDAAEDVIETVAIDKKTTVAALEAALEDADRLLGRWQVPNVFNYTTERALFESGVHARGSNEKRQTVESRARDLRALLETHRAGRRDRGQMIIAILLALMSLLQVRDVVFAMVGERAGPAAQWMVFLALAAVLSLGMARLWQMGSRGP